jgi:hypothetical protein
MENIPDLPRLRAWYAFQKLSTALSSDLLGDGTIAERFDIPVSRPVQISAEVVLSQTVLFKAFRQALAGETITAIVDQAGKTLNAEVTVDAQGSGLLKIDGKGLLFENVRLLSSVPDERTNFLEQVISRHTLAQQEAEQLRAIVRGAAFSDEDFLAVVGTLQTSQESFSGVLSPKMKSRQIAVGDLLPEDTRYWNQLTAPVGPSKSLADFMDTELKSHRKILLAGDARKAMRSIALSFCAPALVPIELLREQDADVVLSMVDEAIQFADHFGLVGTFEICGDWLSRDPRFGPAGERLLDRLFSDPQGLKDTCSIYRLRYRRQYYERHQDAEQEHQLFHGDSPLVFWQTSCNNCSAIT